ncbi:hypothetical protein N1851_000189 [Merluccius polli]|uniref:Peptidase A2 domain-containing protein n=1 Tax=Merluccius polli TaxID=89951 RepID=A0AA47NDF4_MERPO|nr:hypothetical protein N1851_000189 [Merluccius polli]
MANTHGATFNIQPPEPFDFSKPHEWPKWIRRFERFRQASNLTASSDDNQVNTLIYCMGDEADDVLRGLKLSDTDLRNYSKVREGFQSFFVVKRNIVYEHARFNMRKQEENETVDAFVTALYALAEHCNYGTLHDELLRDRIVVGLADKRLSERMQMEKNLDLEKAIDIARKSEAVKKQQNTLRSDTSGVKQMDAFSVDRVFQKRRHEERENPKFNKTKNNGAMPFNSQGKTTKLEALHTPSISVLPIVPSAIPVEKWVTTSVCLAGKAVHGIEEEESESFFLGCVSSDTDPWTVDIGIMDKNVTFKLDSGADVTVVSQTVLNNIFSDTQQPVLQKAEKLLYGPGRNPLDVSGFLRRGLTQTAEKVYVVKDLRTPLLGRPAIVAIGLLIRVNKEQGLMESTNIYVDAVIEGLPVSPMYVESLKEQLKGDSVCSRVMTLCTEGWPAHAKQEPALKNYWPERAMLTEKDGLLLKDTRLVIPAAMRNDVLAKLHEGHQGVEHPRRYYWARVGLGPPI